MRRKSEEFVRSEPGPEAWLSTTIGGGYSHLSQSEASEGGHDEKRALPDGAGPQEERTIAEAVIANPVIELD